MNDQKGVTQLSLDLVAQPEPPEGESDLFDATDTQERGEQAAAALGRGCE